MRNCKVFRLKIWSKFMHGILEKGLAHFHLAQKDMAEALNVSANQVNRWVKDGSNKSVKKYLNALRSFAQAHPEEWLKFMSQDGGKEFLNEFENIFFFTESFPMPEQSAWLISSSPAEGTLKRMREQVINVFLNDDDERELVYWTPNSNKNSITRTLTEIQVASERTPEFISERIKVIICPEYFTLSSYLIFSPEENCFGVISNSTEYDRGSQVLPLSASTTNRVVSMVRPIYSYLINQYHSTRAKNDTSPKGFRFEGFDWHLYDPFWEMKSS